MNAADVIDWIEAELNDEAPFRDVPEILADARARFVGAPSSAGAEGEP